MTATWLGSRSSRRARRARWSRALRALAVAVTLAGIAVSVLVARGWQATVTRQRDERLDRTKASRTATIKSALGQYENALQAARSLWLASDEVTGKDFNTFARSLDLQSRYPGLQNISWRVVVRQRDAAGFVARARAEGERRFTIRPPGRRAVYYVTRYSYPVTPFSSGLGLDARADPAILELARDTGATLLSNQTVLADDLWLPRAERPVAYELFTPVYRTDQPLTGVAEHRREFRGWASGQFRRPTSWRRRWRPPPGRPPGWSCTTRRAARPTWWRPTRPGSGPPGRTCGRTPSPSAGGRSCCATPPCPATPS